MPLLPKFFALIRVEGTAYRNWDTYRSCDFMCGLTRLFLTKISCESACSRGCKGKIQVPKEQCSKHLHCRNGNSKLVRSIETSSVLRLGCCCGPGQQLAGFLHALLARSLHVVFEVLKCHYPIGLCIGKVRHLSARVGFLHPLTAVDRGWRDVDVRCIVAPGWVTFQKRKHYGCYCEVRDGTVVSNIALDTSNNGLTLLLCESPEQRFWHSLLVYFGIISSLKPVASL